MVIRKDNLQTNRKAYPLSMETEEKVDQHQPLIVNAIFLFVDENISTAIHFKPLLLIKFDVVMLIGKQPLFLWNFANDQMIYRIECIGPI